MVARGRMSEIGSPMELADIELMDLMFTLLFCAAGISAHYTSSR